MDIIIREYQEEDIPSIVSIWNTVIEGANAFPQVTLLKPEEAKVSFASQSFVGVAVCEEEILGFYLLHPNNVGRCGHIANAAYVVKKSDRGKHIGEMLVRDSLIIGHELGFQIMQFNAVVSTNSVAIHLYEKLGFQKVGIIPKGFLLGDGTYTDIIIYYIDL